MKTTLKLVTVFFLFFSVQSHAQQRVALQSNGATTIFDSNNPFVDAYNNAVSGDTIYLSGGAMSAPATIDKSLTIFGAGFHEDSTTATFFTKVTGGISIGENADNLHLEGIFFDNNISSGDASFMNSEIKRCYFKGAFSIYGTSANYTENLVVSECVFENGLNLQNTRNCLFTNNIFNQQVSYTSSNLFSNNIFLREGGSWSSPAGKMIFYAYNNVFENNVLFNSSQYYLEGSGNLFQYNLFVNGAPELGTGFIDVNNYYGVLQSTVFVNQVGFTWATTNDNHLQDPATYVGADATPVGIYGGFFPFKAGAVPQNPHISSKIISNQTDINGDLNIQILTGAQND